MKKKTAAVKFGFQKWIRISFGVFLILFGVIGHLVPLLPGSFFIASGLLLLAENFSAVKRFTTYLETRFPTFHSAIQKLRRKDGSLRLGDIIIFGLIIIGVFLVVGYLILR